MKKALFVIDLLKDFMPKSVYPEAKLPVEPADQIIQPVRKLIKKARKESIPVFYLNDSHQPDDLEFEEWPEHCVKGTQGAEVVDPLRPKEGNPVIEKKTYNGFSNPRLQEELEDRGIQQIYEVGLVTNICVLNTAEAALEKGYEVKVIKECVSGLESRKEGLEDLTQAGILLVGREEFLQENPKRPWIAVDGIVLKDDEIVLVYRGREPEGWALPGGYVEYDEQLEDACKGEVKEETGLEVKILRREGPSGEFGIYDDPDRDPRKRMISTVWVCRAVGGQLKAKTDAKEVKTFAPEETLRLDLKFDHERILKDFLDSDLELGK